MLQLPALHHPLTRTSDLPASISLLASIFALLIHLSRYHRSQKGLVAAMDGFGDWFLNSWAHSHSLILAADATSKVQPSGRGTSGPSHVTPFASTKSPHSVTKRQLAPLAIWFERLYSRRTSNREWATACASRGWRRGLVCSQSWSVDLSGLKYVGWRCLLSMLKSLVLPISSAKVLPFLLWQYILWRTPVYECNASFHFALSLLPCLCFFEMFWK